MTSKSSQGSVDKTLPIDDRDALGGGGPKLLVMGEGTFATHALPDSGTIVLGRGEDADVRIDHPSISRRHAVLHLGDAFLIEDAGSSNGTKLRGARLEAGKRIPLTPGELVEVGGMAVMLQGIPVPTSAAPRPEGALGRLHALSDRVAQSEISVLIQGETGVGKEVLARRIHEKSARGGRPFVPINCGALSDTLLQSELFGHEAGAFTGATATKPGLLETAQQGTVFLDEVGELEAAAQVKLLRVLEERQVMRVGGVKARPIDVRFIAATNRDLAQEVESGRFRRDLYYRLNGITLAIPPLRDRVPEIAGLAREFVAAAAKRAGTTGPELSVQALGGLESHNWPGNIRELKNVIERAVVLAGPGPIESEHLMTDPGQPLTTEPEPTDERGRILAALQTCGGNQTRAAELLGISRKTLGVKLDALGIPRPQKRRS